MTPDEHIPGYEPEPWRARYTNAQWHSMTRKAQISVYLAWLDRQFKKGDILDAAKSTQP
jgi:hypothetical protein